MDGNRFPCSGTGTDDDITKPFSLAVFRGWVNARLQLIVVAEPFADFTLKRQRAQKKGHPKAVSACRWFVFAVPAQCRGLKIHARICKSGKETQKARKKQGFHPTQQGDSMV